MGKVDDLSAWRTFVSLCKTKNFSDTAAELDVEVSTISRAITNLETSLGHDLFYRNTRPLQLTEVGKRALEKIEPILSMHQEMISEFTNDSTYLSGKIRLSMAPGFVTTHLMPLLSEFNSMYPNISFEIVGGGSIQDVLNYQADIAGVSSKVDNPRLMSFSRGRNVYVPVASKKYIEAHGFPKTPEDLRQHTVLLYDGSVRPATLRLSNEEGKNTEVVWDKVIRISNILAIKQAVIDGLGLSVDMPLFHCYKEIITGELVPILPGWFNPPAECFLVISKSSWKIRRHRIFLQWLQPKLYAFFTGKEKEVSPFWTPPSRTIIREFENS